MLLKIDLLDVMITQLIEFGDNILGAILILIVGYLLVRFITKVLRRVLSRIGIDRLADRYINGIDFLSDNNIRIVPSAVISKVVYYLAILIVLVAATDVLEMEAVSVLVRDAIDYIPSLFAAFLILIIGLFIADFVKNIALATFTSLNIPAGRFLSSFIFYFILINIFILALQQARINTDFINNNLSILLGGIVLAFAIGYGLASRSILSNYIAHFYSKDKLQLGDNVKIGAYEGVVLEVNNTTLTLFDETSNKQVLIPLSYLNTEVVEVLKRRPNAPSAPPV